MQKFHRYFFTVVDPLEIKAVYSVLEGRNMLYTDIKTEYGTTFSLCSEDNKDLADFFDEILDSLNGINFQYADFRIGMEIVYL